MTIFSHLHRVDPSDAEERQRPSASAPPSVLDLGREIVQLSNQNVELDNAQLALRRQELKSQEQLLQIQDLERRMQMLSAREESLIEAALAMRARTLGDVAVMLGLAWQVLDGAFAFEYEESSYERAFDQASHALLTSLNVVAKEVGINPDEVVGAGTQTFIDRLHRSIGDGL